MTSSWPLGCVCVCVSVQTWKQTQERDTLVWCSELGTTRPAAVCQAAPDPTEALASRGRSASFDLRQDSDSRTEDVSFPFSMFS